MFEHHKLHLCYLYQIWSELLSGETSFICMLHELYINENIIKKEVGISSLYQIYFPLGRSQYILFLGLIERNM